MKNHFFNKILYSKLGYYTFFKVSQDFKLPEKSKKRYKELETMTINHVHEHVSEYRSNCIRKVKQCKCDTLVVQYSAWLHSRRVQYPNVPSSAILSCKRIARRDK